MQADYILTLLDKVIQWLQSQVFTVDRAIETGFAAAGLLLAFLIWRGTVPAVQRLEREAGERNALLQSVVHALSSIIFPALFALFNQISILVLQELNFSPALLAVITGLLLAWVVIRLLCRLMPNKFLARTFAVLIWINAALHIVGVYDQLVDSLNSVAITVGNSRISLFLLTKGIVIAVVLVQVAVITTRFAEQRIRSTSQISPSLQVLAIKAVRFSLFTAAFLMAVSSMGIDLTSLAVLSGAVGVGIGFGLQKIFSNLVSGVILLMDSSIKPGDTIEIGGVYGTIRSLHARYVSILTRDGKEYLVPNENLITNEVVNWTFSDSNVRIKIPVGISYDSDVRLAMQLMEECAAKVNRVLKDPAPAGRLVGFGDSSVDLEVRIWIRDSDKGVVNVQSEVLLNIWDAFHENGIEFPFPQQDVFIKPGSALELKKELKEEKGDE